MSRSLLLLIAFAFIAIAGRAVEPGDVAGPRASASGYIKYWPGELPIVLSAPHNGLRKPDEIPDRAYGVVNECDHGSENLALAVRQALIERFGMAPHLIVCELARAKVDCNREIEEGAQNDATAQKVWREYHALIDEAEEAVLKKWPHGMYLDIHSQGHAKRRIEIGYLLKKNEVLMTDEQLNADPTLAGHSSIRALHKISSASFAELLRGPMSLGGLLEERGVPAIPSPAQVLDPQDPYFFGAYDVLAHGSRFKDQLDGVQLETPVQVRDTPEHCAATARALAESLDVYFEKHYGLKLPGRKN